MMDVDTRNLVAEHRRKGEGGLLNRLGDSRVLHSRTVSHLMGMCATGLDVDVSEAALCGWLHDFGYSISDNRGHAHAAGALLHSQGYKYWKEIYDHGTLQGLGTRMGVLLNIADMFVDSDGNIVGFSKRLQDVASRYGENSEQYRLCTLMVAALQQTDEWNCLSAFLEKQIESVDC